MEVVESEHLPVGVFGQGDREVRAHESGSSGDQYSLHQNPSALRGDAPHRGACGVPVDALHQGRLCQRLSRAGAGAGAVSARNCSSAATIAAPSSSVGIARHQLDSRPWGLASSVALIERTLDSPRDPSHLRRGGVGGRDRGGGDRADPRGVRAPRPRRMGDAGQGLPRQPAGGLSRHARPGVGSGAAEVGDVLSPQPRARAAGGDRRDRALRRRHRRRAGDPRRPRGDLAANRRRGGGLGAGAGRIRRKQRRADRLRRQRRLGGPLPRGGGLRPRRLPRPRRREGRAAGLRAGLAGG